MLHTRYRSHRPQPRRQRTVSRVCACVTLREAFHSAHRAAYGRASYLVEPLCTTCVKCHTVLWGGACAMLARLRVHVLLSRVDVLPHVWCVERVLALLSAE